MQVGDPFIRHTAYCLQVLDGLRTGEFNERGLWPSSEPAEVDEPSQETLIGQFMRWRELVKKYAPVSKSFEPREMFISAVATQRHPGPVIEVGTHKGIVTCFISEVMNMLNRKDKLFTIELFNENYVDPVGEIGYPGESYLKVLSQFREQAPLERVVAIVGDSHELKPLFFGVRPSVIILDGDCTKDGIAEDLQVLRFFNHPLICLVHNANRPEVLDALNDFRAAGTHHYVNFHTGDQQSKGLAALTPN